MPVDTRSDTQLERAYVESKVIKSGLEHLATRLADSDPQLRDGLQDCTDRFDAYMRAITKRTRAKIETRA